MKFILLFFLFVTNISFAQMRAKPAVKAKHSIVSVGYTGHLEVDSILTKALTEYWVFSKGLRYVELEKLNAERPKLELVKSVYYLEHKFNNLRLNGGELGNAFMLRISVGDSYLTSGFDKYSDLSYYNFVDVIKRLQFSMDEIIEIGGWYKAYNALKSKYVHELDDKILLVDKRLLKEKLDHEKFSEIYPHEFEFVDIEEIQKAVIGNSEKYAYITIVEAKPGVYVQMICSTENGKIYTQKHSMLMVSSQVAKKSLNSYIGVKDLKDLTVRMK